MENSIAPAFDPPSNRANVVAKNKKAADCSAAFLGVNELRDLVIRNRGSGIHIHAATTEIELHFAVHQREDRVIPAKADITTRQELRSPLANDDVSRDDSLSAKFFDAEPFALAVAAVFNTSLSFFMGHELR